MKQTERRHALAVQLAGSYTQSRAIGLQTRTPGRLRATRPLVALVALVALAGADEASAGTPGSHRLAHLGKTSATDDGGDGVRKPGLRMATRCTAGHAGTAERASGIERGGSTSLLLGIASNGTSVRTRGDPFTTEANGLNWQRHIKPRLARTGPPIQARRYELILAATLKAAADNPAMPLYVHFEAKLVW